jgi:hypothetical protein
VIVGNGQASKPIVVAKPNDKYGKPIDSSYLVYTQTTPAMAWTINHNFGRLPVVNVLDDIGNVLTPDNIKIDLNTVVITFGVATAGRAVVASVGGAYSDDESILVNPESSEGLPDGTIILRTN